MTNRVGILILGTQRPVITQHPRLSPEVALLKMQGVHGSMGTLLKCKSMPGKSAVGPEILPGFDVMSQLLTMDNTLE